MRSASQRTLALLAVIVVAGGVVRLIAAGDPSAYQSKDEQSYAMIARGLITNHEYGVSGMDDPVHWVPGAPLMFALAYRLDNERRGDGVWDVPSAYNWQAGVGTLVIPAAFLLAFLIAGSWAGLAAAAGVAFYPPLVDASGDLLSEPLGALFATTALIAVVLALRRLSPWWLGAAGVLLGATVLTRADLAAVPLVAMAVVGIVAWRRAERRPALAGARSVLPVLAATVLVTLPWTVFASREAGHLVPLSTGGASNLWVGTYLPGDGSIFGAKESLADEVRARRIDLAGKEYFQLRQADVIETVAARRPELDTEAALRAEALANIGDYAFGDPLGFAAMMARKVDRLWGSYTVGTYGNPRWWTTTAHLAIVGLGLIGLVAGLALTRRPELWLLAAVLLYVTALNAVLVSEARHNLTVMPLVIVAAAAGLALALPRLRELDRPLPRPTLRRRRQVSA